MGAPNSKLIAANAISFSLSFFFIAVAFTVKFSRIAVTILDMRVLLLCHWWCRFCVRCKLFRFFYTFQPTFEALHATPEKKFVVQRVGGWVWANCTLFEYVMCVLWIGCSTYISIYRSTACSSRSTLLPRMTFRKKCFAKWSWFQNFKPTHCPVNFCTFPTEFWSWCAQSSIQNLNDDYRLLLRK